MPATVSSGCFNFLTTVGYLLEVCLRLRIPSFVCISTSAWNYVAKASLTHSLWVHDPNHTHSLVSFQWSGFSKQWVLCLTKNCLQIRKWCPNKGRGVVSAPICANKVRNGQSVSTKAVLQPVKAGAMCTALSWLRPPTSPNPTFLASTKSIFKMNCANW